MTMIIAAAAALFFQTPALTQVGAQDRYWSSESRAYPSAPNSPKACRAGSAVLDFGHAQAVSIDAGSAGRLHLVPEGSIDGSRPLRWWLAVEGNTATLPPTDPFLKTVRFVPAIYWNEAEARSAMIAGAPANFTWAVEMANRALQDMSMPGVYRRCAG